MDGCRVANTLAFHTLRSHADTKSCTKHHVSAAARLQASQAAARVGVIVSHIARSVQAELQFLVELGGLRAQRLGFRSSRCGGTWDRATCGGADRGAVLGGNRRALASDASTN